MRGTNPSGPRSLSKRIRDIADAAAAFLIDARAAAYFLERALGDHPAPRFAIRLWNGRELAWGKPACTVTFRSARVFRACVASGDPTPLAEAYVAGDVSIDGDVGAAVELGLYLAKRAAGAPAAHRSAGVSTARTMRSSDAEARDVHTHCDHPEELFRSFLDERMVYSCAYFAHPDQSLEEAQRARSSSACPPRLLLGWDEGRRTPALGGGAAVRTGVAIVGARGPSARVGRASGASPREGAHALEHSDEVVAVDPKLRPAALQRLREDGLVSMDDPSHREHVLWPDGDAGDAPLDASSLDVRELKLVPVDVDHDPPFRVARSARGTVERAST